MYPAIRPVDRKHQPSKNRPVVRFAAKFAPRPYSFEYHHERAPFLRVVVDRNTVVGSCHEGYPMQDPERAQVDRSPTQGGAMCEVRKRSQLRRLRTPAGQRIRTNLQWTKNSRRRGAEYQWRTFLVRNGGVADAGTERERHLVRSRVEIGLGECVRCRSSGTTSRQDPSPHS